MSRRLPFAAPAGNGWAGLSVILALLVVALLSWLHFEQRRDLGHVSGQLVDIRQARVDLAHGFLAIGLADRAGSASARAEGLALLDRAAAAFEHAAGDPGAFGGVDGARFHADAAAFRDSLTAWRRDGDARGPGNAALRVEFDRLDRQAARLDTEAQKRIQAHASRGERIFLQALVGSAAAFGLLLAMAIRSAHRRQANRARNAAAEAALVESEANLREAGRLAGLGRWRWDVVTDSHVWSEEVYRLYGRDPGLAPAVYPEVRRYFTPDGWACLSAAVERCLADGEPYECDAEVARPDGGQGWITARGQARRDAEGRVVELHGTVQDITARKLAEQALRESETRFRGLFRDSPVALAIIDRDGRVVDRNRRFVELFGYDAETVPDIEAWWSRAYPDAGHRAAARGRWQAAAARAMADGAEIEPVEFHIARDDGSQLDVAISGIVLGDAMVLTFHDVTGWRRAEQALRASEERLRLFVEHAPAALAMFDRDMRYLSVSRRWLADYGLAGRDLIGQSHYEVFPEVGAALMSIHRRALAGEVVRADEDRFERADGGTQWLRWEVRPWYGDAGQVGGIVIFSEDITQAKEARADLQAGQAAALEEQRRARLAALNLMEDAVAARRHTEAAYAALRESEQRHRAVLENAADAVFVAAPDGHCVYANQQAAKLLGYSVEELLTMAIPDITPAAELDEVMAGFRELRETGHLRREMTLSRKDGGGVRVELNAVGLPDGNLFGACRDITEQKRIALELDRHRDHLEELVALGTAELRRANEELRETEFAMESVGIGIHWVELATGRFLNVNRHAAEMLGYSVEEMRGMHVPDIDANQTPESVAWVIDSLRRLGHLNFETSQRRKDGRSIPVAANLYLLPARDEAPERIIVFVTDIGQRKAAEAELVRAKEAAEAANRAKSAFLANMSHEIRTPMNAIFGLTHLLRRDDATPRQRDRLGKIEDATRHLMAIIDDILDLSKIEAGRVELEQRDFALAEVLDHVRAMIAETARAKGLALSVTVEGVPEWLRGDVTRLRQALLNYAGNAVKFTERGAIALRAILLERCDAGLLVRFEVADTGIGIAEADIPRLFHAFEQADVSTTRRFGGTGLGLAITRRLAELMHGDAGVVSRPGGGSTFWFTVRLAEGEGVRPGGAVATAVTAESSPPVGRTGARLLLVEDDAINREVALDLLYGFGLEVDTAEDGRGALVAARRYDYDLILMDVHMPVMDGLAATRAIRALPGWSERPILAMTASAFDEDRAACLAAGMNDFVAKPVDPEKLDATLRKWLPKRTSIMRADRVEEG